MERNIFQTLDAVQNDSDELSDEAEISDEDEEPEWQPTPADDSDPDSDHGNSSSESDSEAETQPGPSRTHESQAVEADPVESFYGKDNATLWSSVPFESLRPPQNRLKIPMNRIPNTKHVSNASDSLLLYIDPNMIQKLVTYTNLEGKLAKGTNWKETDFIEMKAFIGCLIHTGSLHQNDISLEFLFTVVDGNPLLRATFSRDRFSSLLNHIRFDDKSTRTARKAKDKFAPVREVWELFQRNLSKYYHPDAFLTVDEQLVPFRGRCGFLQYMPSKPDKYGLKIFWICEASTSYPLKGIPYLGKGTTFTREATNDSVGCDIVKNLTKDFVDSGRNITCDNFFTDLNLAEELLKRKLSVVGTIRRNKRFLPPKFQSKKDLDYMDSKFVFREGVALVSFQGKKNKNTILLSTMHNDTSVSDENKKPEIVLTYNKTKAGVDSMDQMAHSFTVKRKTKRWPLVMFFNMIDLAGIAGRVIWRHAFPTHRLSMDDNRQMFLLQVSKELVYEQVQRRAANSSTMNSVYRDNINHVMQSLATSVTVATQTKPKTPTKPLRKNTKRQRSPSQTTPRKRCSLCPSNKDRKSRVICSKCKKNICGEHSVTICQNCD